MTDVDAPDPEGRFAAVDRAVEANVLHRPVDVGPEVVTRPAGEHTATVHAYLRHLRAQGLECVPEPLGVADAVVERIRAVIALRGNLAARGVEPQRTRVADGAAERDLEEIAWIEEHREELEP